MLTQLLINTLTGASTGYITNNIAIKMLFKKYFGRFGGMIEDTHEEFVQNIAQLIEKDLINHTTLAEEFLSPAFGKYVKGLVQDMFVTTLPERSLPLKELQGMYETKENMLSFLQTHKQQRKAIKQTLAARPLHTFISELQLLHFSKTVTKTLNHNKESYLQTLLPSLKTLQINALITEELFTQIEHNIQDIINHFNLSHYDTQINTTIQQLLKAIDADALFATTIQEFEDIPLKNFLNNQAQSMQKLLETFIAIALTPQGTQAINTSVTAILENIKQVDASVLNLLDDDIKDALQSFIKKELPRIITQIIAFIDKNEKDLELLLNTSIDDALSDGAFASIKKKFVAIFYTNIVQDFGILQQIKAFMHEHQEKAQEEISTQLLALLKNKSIGELYSFASEKRIITPQKITDLIIQNLTRLQTDKNFKLITIALQKQLKEYVKIDHQSFQAGLLHFGINKLKSEYLYNKNLQAMLLKQTQNIVTDMQTQTLNAILGTRFDVLAHNLLKSIDEAKIFDTLLDNANKILNKPINETLDLHAIDVDYKKYIDDFIAQKSIKDIIVQLQNEEIYKTIQTALIQVIVDNLEEILQGNVSEAVKNELSKLPPSQIKDMVEEFMGEELKPINYFGALLGGLTGAGVGALAITSYANPLIYSLVGVATNYLAIKMLFQPYAPLQIANVKIPLTEGVLPANKAKMAHKMSDFVDEFMLNGTSIEDFFTKNSAHLKAFITAHLQKDNYAIIDTLIHQKSNTQDVSNKVITLLFTFLENNETLISEKLFTLSMSYYEKRKTYAQEASSFVFNKAMQMDLSPFLYEQFRRHLNQEKSLRFLEHDVTTQLNNFRDAQFNKLLYLLKNEAAFTKMLTHAEAHFALFIQKHSLNTLLNTHIKQTITTKANEALITLFYGHGTINEFLNFFTKGEFGKNTRLSDMINGMLPEIIRRNLHRIMDEAVLPALRENKKLIRKEIMKKVPFGAGWVVKRDINRTIDIILDEKVPHFLEEKLEEIHRIILKVLDTQMKDLGYREDIIKQKKVDDLISSILASETFNASLQKSMAVFMETLFAMQLKEILAILHINSLQDIYKLLKPQATIIMHTLAKNLSTNKAAIFEILHTLINATIIPDILNNTRIKDILKNVDKAMLYREFAHLQENLKASPAISQAFQKLLDAFIASFLEEEFLDPKVFKKDLQVFLRTIIKEKENLHGVLFAFFQSLLTNLNALLDTKLKDNTLQIIINAAFESMSTHIAELLHAVDFKKVITKEINAMHPKELEDMFYSFAGPYFHKLILYGSLGFFFGLFTLIEL